MGTSQQSLPFEYVTAEILRQHFNDDGIWQRVQAEELVALVNTDTHCVAPPLGDPVCTHSQTMHYYTHEAKLVAIVHQYQRPDGKLGASGLPDPKWLRLSDKIIGLQPTQRRNEQGPDSRIPPV